MWRRFLTCCVAGFQPAGLAPAAAALLALAGFLDAQTNDPKFTEIRSLTNREMRLQFSAPTGLYYRLETSSNLSQWQGFLTLYSTGSLQHTDSAAPYLATRFYKALQATNAGVVTGDHLVTSQGDLIIHPINHASLAMTWSNKVIYVDPSNKSYSGVPRADLILFTHEHGDHFNASATSGFTNTNATIIAPQTVRNALPASLQNLTTVLGYGMSTSKLGLLIEAVPAYNLTSPTNHAWGVGNGYVLTAGDKRIYISGDTEDSPQMRALTNIDVAFLAMNRPYTMTVSQAVSAVREFRPRVVYPDHYSTNNPPNPPTDLWSFQEQVMTNPGSEVRIRKWY